jgi:hypothetical protein
VGAILDLLADLRRELNVSYMFISHDISTVRGVHDIMVFTPAPAGYGQPRGVAVPRTIPTRFAHQLGAGIACSAGWTRWALTQGRPQQRRGNRHLPVPVSVSEPLQLSDRWRMQPHCATPP